MFTDEAVGAVIGVAVAEDGLAAVSAEKIFPDFDKMLRHLFELKMKIFAGGFGNSI